MKKAFSLIELLIAISILAIVAALIIPKYLNTQQQAELAVLNKDIDELNTAYGKWAALGGHYSNVSSWTPELAAAEMVYFLSLDGSFNGGDPTVNKPAFPGAAGSNSRNWATAIASASTALYDSGGANASWTISAQNIAFDNTVYAVVQGGNTYAADSTSSKITEQTFTMVLAANNSQPGMYYKIGKTLYLIVFDPTLSVPFYYPSTAVAPASVPSYSTGPAVNIALP